MRILSVCFLTLILFTVSAAYAEPVRGRVVDPDGRAVPGARVLLVGAGAIITSAASDTTGAFTLETPDKGRFEVRVAVEGFRAKPLTVDAGSPRDLGTIQLDLSAVSDAVVVSAAQVEIPLSSAAASVTVLTGDELQSRQIESVADALRLVPGLNVIASGGRGGLTSVFPRGGESDYSLVFVDGVQANAFGGGFDFAHLPVANIDRIEVVRGPQSALYGSNAIGSVIRIVTRKGGTPTGSASIEGGSFGTERFTGATSGSHEGWQWGASAEQLTTNNLNGGRTAAGETVSNDEYDRHDLAGSLGWSVPGKATIRGDVRYSKNERGSPGPFGTDPGGTYGGIDTVSGTTNENWLSSFSTTVPLGERVRAAGNVAYSHLDGEFASPFGDSFSLSRRTTARGQVDTTLAPGLDLSAGFEYLHERAGSTFITGPGTDPIPVRRSVAGTFGEARWEHGSRLFVTGGVRADRIERSPLDADPDGFSPRPAMADDTVVSVNPKVSAAWIARPDSGTSTKIRGAAGTGIRPPDGFELSSTDNPSLKPERSRSFEAGVDQALADGRVLATATWFQNNYDDLLVAVGSFSQASRYRTDNIANARARGIELAGTTRVKTGRESDLQVRLGYTFLDTDVLAVDQSGAAPPPFAVGDPLIRRPRHQFSADALFSAGQLTTYLEGGARSRALDVDPSFGTFGGLFYNPGFTVWSIGSGYRVHRLFEVFGRIDNLFDEKYEESLGFPALGRGAMVGLRVAAGR